VTQLLANGACASTDGLGSCAWALTPAASCAGRDQRPSLGAARSGSHSRSALGKRLTACGRMHIRLKRRTRSLGLVLAIRTL